MQSTVPVITKFSICGNGVGICSHVEFVYFWKSGSVKAVIGQPVLAKLEKLLPRDRCLRPVGVSCWTDIPEEHHYMDQ